MSHFVIMREDRDAWAVIRGFVYQVELTIDRWLHLQSDQVLELERGEDIDTIQHAMTSTGDEQARLLEQIKVRESNLTLRSEAARAALASFFENYRTNRASTLSFRYVTNAQVGTERDSPVPDRTPLIVIWGQIRNGSLDQQQERFHLRIIRDFLTGTSKPSDLNAETWNTFTYFIKNAPDSEILRLIRNVEWLTAQVDTTDISKQLQNYIATQYLVTSEQADNIYSHLFFYVFKRLSKPGIKQLTSEELAHQITLPALSTSDSVLLSHLSVFIKNLDKRVETLEEQMSDLHRQHMVEFNVEELREACRKVTSNSINRIIENQHPIVRHQFRNESERLLTSTTRHLFVIGASGVGKSTALALEAKQLLEHGWTVLLLTVLPGKLFTLDYAAELVRQQFVSGSASSLKWHQIVQKWFQEYPSDSPGLAIMLDAIADANLDHIAQQLTLLNDSLIAAPLNRVKVISSCRDVELDDLLRNSQMPFFVNIEDFQRTTARGYRVAIIDNFKSEELDRALMEIGAVELLSPERPGDRVDSHLATLRDLLKHPGTFEHYASLHASGDVSSLENMTWSGLIERRLNYMLHEAERLSGIVHQDLLGDLVILAELGRQRKAQEFLLDAEEVKNRLPNWFEKHQDSSITPYAALISCGVLLEQAAPENKRLVGFRITDAGAYLLSFQLEQETSGTPTEEFRETVKGWIDEAWNYSSLLDAVLALSDRLSLSPRNPQLLLLLDTLIDTHRYASLFRLMRPAVLSSLFELIKRDESDWPYKYTEAAIEVRPSSEALQIIRRHLRDINTEARRLAAKLAGLHRDEESVPDLIHLLEDADEDVRHEAFTAFGFIGKSAIPFLLSALTDVEKSEEARSHYLIALRNIGYRNEEVSAVLSNCLADALGAGEPEVLQFALLTAAHLRDRNHAASAIAALQGTNRKVVHAAAKLLTEAPDPPAFQALLGMLRPRFSADGAIVERYRLPSQLMAALHRTDRIAAETELVELVRQGLDGIGELALSEAVRAAQKLELTDAYPLILNQLVSELKQPLPHNLAWHTSEALGSTWQMDQLDALVTEAHKLLAQGTDIARLFVDAIQPNMLKHDESPMGDCLNRAKDLRTIIKCRAANFVPEASRLLEQAFSSTEELSRYLWMAGDTRAESLLLTRLERTDSEADRRRRFRTAIMRALGTCGAERGATAVLDYLRTDESISRSFPRETLHPLLQREIVAPSALSEIALSSRNSSGGRVSCLIALAELDAREHTDLFIKLVSSEDKVVQLYAVRLLGFTGDSSAVETLRHLLRSNIRSGIKSQAAEALGWLDAREAVHDIEDAFEDSDDSVELTTARFLNALSRFREQSSLPLLLKRLQSAPRQSRRYYLEALGAFSTVPQGEQVLLDQLEECVTEPVDIFDNQKSLIEGLVEHAPQILLERFNTHFDHGRLNTGGRIQLARAVSYLFKNKKVESTLILQTMKRLVCDYDVSVRDRASHALRFMDADFCQQLYDELQHTETNEWTRACAVWTLGYWDSNLAEIESARYDRESLVRRAADEALLLRKKHIELERHLNIFAGLDGLARLSSYLCLSKQGNLSTIWRLHDSINKQSLAYTYVRHVTERISNRLRDEYRKRQEEQEKFFSERGTIWFD